MANFCPSDSPFAFCSLSLHETISEPPIFAPITHQGFATVSVQKQFLGTSVSASRIPESHAQSHLTPVSHVVLDIINFNQTGIFRGAGYMGNIFLAASLINLASEEVGCILDNGDVDTDCDVRIHGFLPASLVTNMAVISGLASAFLMPVIGAIVDYTSHRHTVGWVSAAVLTAIQAAQIYTVSSTWYPMAILQAIAGFVNFIQVTLNYAYLPEVARDISESTMTQFSGCFVLIQFASSELFLIIVVGVGTVFALDTVATGQLSQAILTLVLVATAIRSWGQLLPKRPASHKLPEGHSLVLEGFRQNWRTMTQINIHYKNLRWYLFAVAFAEAGCTAFLAVAVTFLTGELGFSGIQVGLVFITALTASLPGTWASSKVTAMTNPNTSLKIDMIGFVVVTASGAFLLTKEREMLGYVWGVLWGFFTGWFYPAENLMFAMLQPKSQEAELTGFFAYSNTIIVWMPPFIFSILVENGVEQRYGLLSMCLFQAVAVGFLSLCSPWDEMLKETRGGPKIVIYDDSNDDNSSQKDIDRTLTTLLGDTTKTLSQEPALGCDDNIDKNDVTVDDTSSNATTTPQVARNGSDGLVSVSTFLMAGDMPPEEEQQQLEAV